MPIAPGNAASRRGKRASNIALLLILALAAYIRFTVVAGTEIVSPYRADAREYFFSAYNLDHYGVYSSQVTWPPEQHVQPPPADDKVVPGYPLFLLSAGHPEPTVEYEHRIMFVQAVLSVLSVWLLYAIAIRFLRRSLACVAASLAALSPHLVVMNTYVLTEALFFFLLLASILLSVQAIESGARWRFVLAGIAWGLSALVRPTALFVVPLAALAIVAVPRLKPRRAHAVAGLLGFALALSPWLIRDSLLPPQPQPGKLVNFLLHGSYPGFIYDHDAATYGDPYRHDPNAAAYGRDLSSALVHIARNFRDEPLAQLRWYLIGKPGYFLSWTDVDAAGDVFVYAPSSSPYFTDRFIDTTHRISKALHWPLMMLGMLGACLPWWRPRRWGLAEGPLISTRVVSGIWFYALAFHMIGAPYPRYGIPFRPLLFVLALLVIQTAAKCLGSGRGR